MFKIYVSSVIDLIKNGENTDVVFKNLRNVLEQRGHLKLLPRILRVIERELTRSDKSLQSAIVVARSSDSDSVLVEKLTKEIGLNKSAAQIKIDETIIGGAVVRHNHTEIDASYKTALHTLYQSITK